MILVDYLPLLLLSAWLRYAPAAKRDLFKPARHGSDAGLMILATCGAQASRADAVPERSDGRRPTLLFVLNSDGGNSPNNNSKMTKI